MYRSLLLNVDELLLKGNNQGLFFEKLRSHVHKVLRDTHLGEYQLYNDGRRMVVESPAPIAQETVSALCKVPGLHSLYLARKLPLEFERIMGAVEEEIQSYPQIPSSFKVQTKRSYKRFPKDSMTISREIGHLVASRYPQMKVQMENPELVIDIKVLESGLYVSTRRPEGVGGLPVGPSGTVICLLSGGFDSPVASYLMSKRGCEQHFAFFYAYPYVGEEVKKKIIDLAKVLSQFQMVPQLHIIPFGRVQKIISDNCSPAYRTLFFRRAMMECSTLLADKVGGRALVTGDSLGQVSSQTLANMTLVDQSTPLPILRPLIGFNKIEIINLARKIGTHDISIIPHDDACSLFAAKHPVTNPFRGQVEAFTQKVSLTQDIRESLEQREIYTFPSPGKVEKLA